MVISAAEYARFQALLHEKTGILLGDNKQYLVASRLSSLLHQYDIPSFSALLQRLESFSGQSLLQEVIDRMTTNETLWFRDSFPFVYLVNHILPEIKQKNISRASIWCAACSSGQEPYSISIAIEEAMSRGLAHRLPAQVDILATDISQRVLQQARQGEYQSLEITRGLSPERQQRFFEQHNGIFKLKPDIRKRVRFAELNLLKLPYRTVGQLDVIFCRNVLIYFSSDLKKKVLKGMTECLKPGGYLFLGASESMPPEMKEFEMVRCNPGLAYRKV
jgi:chemotaxis protein methyltransferase CheR